MGFRDAFSITEKAVVSYTHHFTLTLKKAVSFCSTFPDLLKNKQTAGRYPASFFRGARTFLSPRKGRDHPAI